MAALIKGAKLRSMLFSVEESARESEIEHEVDIFFDHLICFCHSIMNVHITYSRFDES